MSLETGLNLGLLHKNTAFSKRHNTFLSGISCWKGKYASCDAKWLVLHFSALFLIFIITMIRYWNDKIKRHLKGSINFLIIYDNKVVLRLYLILYSYTKGQLSQKRNCSILQLVLYFTWPVVMVKFILQ